MSAALSTVIYVAIIVLVACLLLDVAAVAKLPNRARLLILAVGALAVVVVLLGLVGGPRFL